MRHQPADDLPNLFGEQLKSALANFHDPAWLGANSPLAGAAFLGRHLPPTDSAPTPLGRARALRTLLGRAADTLWGDDLPPAPGTDAQRAALLRQAIAAGGRRGAARRRYAWMLLELHYFQRYFRGADAPLDYVDAAERLSVTTQSYYRHLADARERLAAALVRLAMPSVSLERPRLDGPLIGRDAVLAACRRRLRAGESVALTGPGGIGKTALGTALFNTWPTRIGLWYTVQPGLNDDPESLLLALALALRDVDSRVQRGNLWLHLMAHPTDPVPLETALGLVRADLGGLPARAFLLCVDEADMLRTGPGAPFHAEHTRLLELLERLAAMTPLLLIGQKPVLHLPHTVRLDPLDRDDAAQLLRNAGVDAPPLAPAELHRRTEGNPRLLRLFATLLQAGPPGDAQLLRTDPAFEPLLNRLWHRLSDAEKDALAAVAVFHGAAPVQPVASIVDLEPLAARGLVSLDHRDHAALLPSIRALVLRLLPAERLRPLHLWAAGVRAAQAAYTAAAAQLHAAGQVAAAVALWYDHADAELAQRQAHAARALFLPLDPDALPEDTARKLLVIQNQLRLLQGDAERVLEATEAYGYHTEGALSDRLLEQLTQAHIVRGDVDAAVESAEQAAERLEMLAARTVDQFRRIGVLQLEVGRPADAHAQLQGAEYALLRTRGQLAYAQGRLAAARDAFERLVPIAEAVGDRSRLAKAHHLLAMAHGNAGRLQEAERHAAVAETHYAAIGDELQQHGLRAERAGWHLNLRQYAETVSLGAPALAFFERIGHDLWLAHLNSNLAEAYYGLGDLAQAETHVFAALARENPKNAPYASYTLGLVRAAQNRPDEARAIFLRSVDQARANGDQFIEAYLQRALGELLWDHFSEGRAEGERRLRQALTLFDAMGIAGEASDIRRRLAG